MLGFLCDDLYMSSGSCPGKNKFSVDCWGVLKTADWILLYIRGRIGESDVGWWNLQLARPPYS